MLPTNDSSASFTSRCTQVPVALVNFECVPAYKGPACNNYFICRHDGRLKKKKEGKCFLGWWSRLKINDCGFVLLQYFCYTSSIDSIYCYKHECIKTVFPSCTDIIGMMSSTCINAILFIDLSKIGRCFSAHPCSCLETKFKKTKRKKRKKLLKIVWKIQYKSGVSPKMLSFSPLNYEI